MKPFLIVEREDSILTVRMDSPETRNALSEPAQMQEFVDLCASVKADRSVKVVVLTGAMQPAAMRASDASFNLGAAVTALNLLEPGVYISMSGRIFPASDVKKDRSRGIFEAN